MAARTITYYECNQKGETRNLVVSHHGRIYYANLSVCIRSEALWKQMAKAPLYEGLAQLTLQEPPDSQLVRRLLDFLYHGHYKLWSSEARGGFPPRVDGVKESFPHRRFTIWDETMGHLQAIWLGENLAVPGLSFAACQYMGDILSHKIYQIDFERFIPLALRVTKIAKLRSVLADAIYIRLDEGRDMLGYSVRGAYTRIENGEPWFVLLAPFPCRRLIERRSNFAQLERKYDELLQNIRKIENALHGIPVCSEGIEPCDNRFGYTIVEHAPSQLEKDTTPPSFSLRCRKCETHQR